MENLNPKIKIDDYVILQRQKYTKLHKIGSIDSTAMLGKDQLELRGVIDQKYGTTFKMIPKEGKIKRFYTLDVCSETEIRNLRDILGIQESGIDNRNIIDNGESQTLNAQDISKLREECQGSSQILEKIVENSKTFNSKTEYAQEKYLKKKERKYFEFVQIRQPTIRLLTEIYYRQDPDKIMGIRMDTLSQILTYSNVCSFGNFLLYESGTSGLMPATLLNAMGSNTEAKLVHMHPGNICQKQALLALNFPEEQLQRCISVNIYSVLRQYFQINIRDSTTITTTTTSNENNFETVENSTVSKETIEDTINDEETPCKKIKLSTESFNSDKNMESTSNDDNEEKKEEYLPKWQKENKRACELLKEKFDSLIIVAREHPSSIVKTLLPFLKSSRPIVIFNLSKEILMELYVELKSTTKITGLHLKSNWLRMYQILPNRTHPEVQMSGNSGYLLCGYTIG